MVLSSGRLVFILSLAVSLHTANGQLVPGQMPSGPPAQPGQVDTQPKKAPTPADKPDQNAKPSTFQAPDDPNTIRVRTETVLVPTSVLDPDGHGYVNGLQASDFEVLDNDKPQKVQAEITEQPMSVVLVIQANADTAPLLPKIKKSGILLHGLVTGSNGDVAVLTFDHQMYHLLDFTSDPDKIDDSMQLIREGSSVAAVIDAVSDANRMLQRHDPTNKRRRVIILMSQNVDKGSEMHLSELITQIQFSGVIVYSINISKMLAAFLKKEGYPRSPNGNIPPAGLPPLPGGEVWFRHFFIAFEICSRKLRLKRSARSLAAGNTASRPSALSKTPSPISARI
jgi:hypothetical protein